MKQQGKMVVWPANINSGKTRFQGRRIAKARSIADPKLAEVEAAAASLSLHPVAMPGRARPGSWWEKNGYIVIERQGKGRISILREIAKQVMKQRQPRQS